MNFRLKSHKWVTLVNPRNGKVRVNACARCGAMSLRSAPASECKASSIKERSLAGWKALPQVV